MESDHFNLAPLGTSPLPGHRKKRNTPEKNNLCQIVLPAHSTYMAVLSKVEQSLKQEKTNACNQGFYYFVQYKG